LEQSIEVLPGSSSYPGPWREIALTAEEMLELVKSRSSPGVLILGLDNRLLYSNEEALALLKNLNTLPPEVRDLCEQAKTHDHNRGTGSKEPACALLWTEAEGPYSLRAFLIGAQSKKDPATHVMVLVEKITEQHGLILKKAKTQYALSDREIEVVALVSEGLANKEIGARLFISDHTVKDHLKNIMRKMSAASRSEIIHILK
jgi:DNA-binding CsgD family transcriptional regulator